LRFVYAPRFILSCTDGLLKAVGERSRADNVLIHTHASESRGELDAVRAVTGTSNLRALHARGCLHHGTVVAHGVWVEGEEEECLVASGAAVCHCPGSNLKLGSGIAPVPRLLQRGVRVALGADGAACDNTLDARFELRLAGLVHRLAGGPAVLSAQQALDMATLGGASALGQSDALGSIEVGKRADIVCLEPGLGCAAPDLVSALVYGATSASVRHVIVAGRQRVAHGELVDGRDRGELFNRARAATEVLSAQPTAVCRQS
jgi:cytosine/adenosine deaminase-related metal-dependent hydrolase